MCFYVKREVVAEEVEEEEEEEETKWWKLRFDQTPKCGLEHKVGVAESKKNRCILKRTTLEVYVYVCVCVRERECVCVFVCDGAEEEEEEEEEKREEGDKQIIIEKKKKVTEIAIRSSADARTPTKNRCDR